MSQCYRKCQAANCDCNFRATEKFFNFPSDSERKKQWTKVCDRDAGWFTTSRNQKLCQMHFNGDQFENGRYDGLRKLKWNAVPRVKSSIGPETNIFIKKLGAAMPTASGESRSKDYLLQKVSIAIQRRNASCILGTLGRNRIDDFYLL